MLWFIFKLEAHSHYSPNVALAFPVSKNASSPKMAMDGKYIEFSDISWHVIRQFVFYNMVNKASLNIIFVKYPHNQPFPY